MRLRIDRRPLQDEPIDEVGPAGAELGDHLAAERVTAPARSPAPARASTSASGLRSRAAERGRRAPAWCSLPRRRRRRSRPGRPASPPSSVASSAGRRALPSFRGPAVLLPLMRLLQRGVRRPVGALPLAVLGGSAIVRLRERPLRLRRRTLQRLGQLGLPGLRAGRHLGHRSSSPVQDRVRPARYPRGRKENGRFRVWPCGDDVRRWRRTSF